MMFEYEDVSPLTSIACSPSAEFSISSLTVMSLSVITAFCVSEVSVCDYARSSEVEEAVSAVVVSEDEVLVSIVPLHAAKTSASEAAVARDNIFRNFCFFIFSIPPLSSMT
jgi:hypothetical protein